MSNSLQMTTYQSVSDEESRRDKHDTLRPGVKLLDFPRNYACLRRFIIMFLAVFMIITAILVGMSYNDVIKLKQQKPIKVFNEHEFDHFGRYVMNDYDISKPSSNFLSGLGGLWGIPMWAFYVNRGQGIASFGVQNKDGALLKFYTAEKAYQSTPFLGFRTFLKGSRQGNTFEAMPFSPRLNEEVDEMSDFSRKMFVGKNEMEIEEEIASLGLRTNVLYFTVTDQKFPALVRQTTFTNTDRHISLELEVLDGLGRVLPGGLGNSDVDAMGRTREAWMNVYNIPGSSSKDTTHPFFHISQGVEDTAVVQEIFDGHFAVAFIEENLEEPTPPPDHATDIQTTVGNPLPFIVDPALVFGFDTTMTRPRAFFKELGLPIEKILSLPQVTTSRTPCAFAGARLKLRPRQNITITSIYGHASSLDEFLKEISPVLLAKGFTAASKALARSTANAITNRVAMRSALPIFDAHIEQSYLDNTLRGGLPLNLGSSKAPRIFHVYSRIHGDIERDYNNFQLDPSYFSQGPGNFRDVSQNRRLDVIMNPTVGDFNVRIFLSLLQADGYNPMTVATSLFKVPATSLNALVSQLRPLLFPKQSPYFSNDNTGSTNRPSAPENAMRTILSHPFRPGQLFSDFMKAGIQVPSGYREDVLRTIIASSTQTPAALFAQNGYWSDHWTYTLDHVLSYVTIYPEAEENLLYNVTVPFFFSPAVVRPRSRRHVLVTPAATASYPYPVPYVRAYGAIAMPADADYPPERAAVLSALKSDTSIIRDATGAGGVWQQDDAGNVLYVTTLCKLLFLGAIKFTTLDPAGMGIEMEGGKPGWNDAMNGLPGLMGSGMPETYEMIQLLKYCLSVLERFGEPVDVPLEISQFFLAIVDVLDSINTTDSEYEQSLGYPYTTTTTATKSFDVSDSDFALWDALNTARENYRESVAATVEGEFIQWASTELTAFLDRMLQRAEAGVVRALGFGNGLSPTYFHYEAVDYDILPKNEEPSPPSGTTPSTTRNTYVRVKSFRGHSLPYFLEGPTRHMKILDNGALSTTPFMTTKAEIYQRTKTSALYDAPLGMFTLCESLASMSQELGRMKAFSPGWLENQSVWLHMSYKFYLELLRGGLYAEFFNEISTGLVPFMPPAKYGRSPIELSSFLASSAFPDPALHGAGFLARLSGSTAEILSMWFIMMTGHNPFTVSSAGQLQLALRPILPSWFFDNNSNKVSFIFLGELNVTYYNPTRMDTWKITEAPTATVVFLDDSSMNDSDGIFEGEVAQSIRNRKVKSIDFTL